MIYCLILFIFISCLILLLYTDKGQPSMWGSLRCPICFEPCHRIAFDGRLQNILHIGYSKDWTKRKDQNKRASQPFANFAFFPQFHLRRAISQDQPVTLEYYGILYADSAVTLMMTSLALPRIDPDFNRLPVVHIFQPPPIPWVPWVQANFTGAARNGAGVLEPGSSQRFQRTETAFQIHSPIELIELIESYRIL